MGLMTSKHQELGTCKRMITLSNNRSISLGEFLSIPLQMASLAVALKVFDDVLLLRKVANIFFQKGGGGGGREEGDNILISFFSVEILEK